MIHDERLFKTLLDNLVEGVYFVDRKRRIQYWNKGAEAISGFCGAEVAGRRCADNILMHVDDRGRCLCEADCPLSATMRDGKQRRQDVYLHHKEGHRVPVRVAVAPIYDENEDVIGAVETFYDIAAEMAAVKQLRESEKAALTCSLTGAPNRRYTERLLRQRCDEWTREGGQLAVLFIDVDDFKRMNGAYGHPVGDIALKMVARTLTNSMRSYDVLGRWGGEEFVAIMPNIMPHEVEDAAERMRLLVERSSRDITEKKLTVTVSVGATWARDGDTPDELINRSNALMLESKRKGKNRVSTG